MAPVDSGEAKVGSGRSRLPRIVAPGPAFACGTAGRGGDGFKTRAASPECRQVGPRTADCAGACAL